MNFPLRQLESAVDEYSWSQGEQLLEEDAVREPKALEKGIWVTEVDGYETEVRLSAGKVVEGTCDCERYLDIGICEHLVATLLLLRRQLQDQDRKKQQRQQKRKNTQRLTTKTVLQNVELEELAAFVKEYARTNRNFAIALKARFASTVEAMDSRDKYAQLLDTTIKAVRKSDREISLRGSQRLLKVLGELQLQSEEAQMEGDFITASDIARTIIEKITPLIRKATGKKEEIRAYVLQAFDTLNQLLSKQPAPVLLRQLWVYSLEEYHKLVYRSQQIDQYFFKLMLQLAQDQEQLETLLGKLDLQIDTYEREERPVAPLLLQKVSALEKAGKTEAARQLTERNLTQPNVLEYAIRQAQKRNQTHRVKALAQTGLRLDPPQGTRSWLQQLLLDIAQREHDQEAILKYALQRFYEKPDLKYYLIARQASPAGDWPDQLSSILQQLGQMPYSPSRRDIQARILLHEQYWEQLMDFAGEVRSLDLMQLVDEPLLLHFPERTKQLYESLIREYTQHHLGRQTARRIRTALERLLEIGADKLALRMIDDFRSNYGERHTLMEELEDLGV